MRPSDPLLRALPVLRPRWPRLALAATFGVLSLGSALVLAGVSAWLITRAWQMPPVLDLSVAVVAVRAFGISRGVLHYCERLASHDTALRAAGSARQQIYRRMAGGPPGHAAHLSGGELAGRVGADVDSLADVLVRAVLPITVAAVLSVAAVVVIAVISPAAAVVLAICLLVAGVFAPWLSARSAAYQETLARRYHAERDVAAMLALDHAAELRVSGRLADVVAESSEQQRKWGKAMDAAAVPAAFGAAVPTAAVGAAVLGCAVVGIGIASVVAPTTVAILMLLPLSSFEATTALPAAGIQLTRSRIAARRLLDLTETTASRTTWASGIPTSVDIPAGNRLAVTGPSGSGKTTLLMRMAGLLSPGTELRVDGGLVYGADTPRKPSEIAFFAEDAHVFDTTVRDNLLVARGGATDDELAAALRRVGLDIWLAHLPDGLSTVLAGGAAALSAGQRRRLLLARALISAAGIVLLDEPTEHLDAAGGREILTGLLTSGSLFPADRIVVVATHHDDDIGCPRLNLVSDEYAHQP